MAWSWAPYIPVAQRRAQAAREMARLERKGLKVQPVRIAGRRIAQTFWGEGWCRHLKKFSDFENRLPRGRTYVRSGAVCHLEIGSGQISGKVSGSELYDVRLKIRALPADKWARLKSRCVGQVSSALELLQGRLSDRVMSVVTDRDQGLFPGPREMTMSCSCPDWATMCKHVAAVLYGVGARLDESPELLFLLRGVDYNQLVSRASVRAVVGRAASRPGRRLREDVIGEVFGIDVTQSRQPAEGPTVPSARSGRRPVAPSRAAAKASQSAAHARRPGKRSRRR